MSNQVGLMTIIDKRMILFPVCSGILGTFSVVMQIVAIATSYWAHFKREGSIEALADGRRVDPLYEEGHYGLWTVCLTIFDGQPLDDEECSANIAHFHPSSWRIFAGIIATICAVLLLLFLATIPFQTQHLQNQKPVYCKYKTLTRIKMILSMVGVICAIMAAVLFGINTHHKHYKEPKGWSFGLQVIVIVAEVFLFISSSAENVVAASIDNASPLPQYLFTISGRKEESQVQKDDSFKYPANNSMMADRNCSINTNSDIKTNKLNVPMNQEFSRDNPIFIDSDNENEMINTASSSAAALDLFKQNYEITSLKNESQQNSIPFNVSVRFSNGGSVASRFKVEKSADMYTSK